MCIIDCGIHCQWYDTSYYPIRIRLIPILGVGWRWFVWLCAIILGLNFLAIFLFVHETRFNRTPQESSGVNDSADWEKNSLPQMTEQKEVSDVTVSLIGTKKTLMQNLSLWSGTSHESYFSHFLRPFLLIVYPAVARGALACKWLPSTFTVHHINIRESVSSADSLVKIPSA